MQARARTHTAIHFNQAVSLLPPRGKEVSVKGLSSQMTLGQREVPSYRRSTQRVLPNKIYLHTHGAGKYRAGKAQEVERRGVELSGLVTEWARISDSVLSDYPRHEGVRHATGGVGIRLGRRDTHLL